MEELKHNKKNLLKPVLITFFYFIIVLICALFHEVWCDEAQVWMLCKHMNLFELFHHLTNEAHPSLFYLLVMPFAKLSDNFIFQKLICILASSGAIFILWRYSKFNNLTKTIITLSAPFIYYFPVISRNYSLVPFIMLSIAALYNNNKNHPVIYSILIALLANTHAIMLAISGLLGLEFIYKNIFISKKEGSFDKKFILPSFIIVFGILALILQLSGTTHSNVALEYHTSVNKIDAFIRVFMVSSFQSFDEYFLKTHSNYFTPYTLTMFLATIISWLVGFIYLFRRNKKIFAFVFLGILFQVLIYTFLYSSYIFLTRTYCAYMIFLFGFWVIADKKPSKFINVIISIIFALTFMNSIKSYYGDIVFEYTSSKRTAQFIENNINPDNSIIYIDDAALGLPIVFYLKPEYKIYETNGKPIKYVVWTKELLERQNKYEISAFYEILRKFNKEKDLYMITSYNPYEKEDSNALIQDDFELVYKPPYTLTNLESVKIWKYKK